MSKLDPLKMYTLSDKGCSRIVIIIRSQVVFEIIIFSSIDKSEKYNKIFIILKLAKLGEFLKQFFR